MRNIELVKNDIEKSISTFLPDFTDLSNDENVQKFLSFQEICKRQGLNYADSLIQECEPLILELRNGLSESNVTYREYSNKFVDAAITFILMQVNGNLLLSMASDTNQYQKNELKNQNAYTISLINKLEKHYRNQQTQEYVNKVKAKVGGSEQRVNPSGSCYIATIIYNDYNSKEVYILREYRDKHLAKKTFGKVLIYLYYKSSPILKPLVSKSMTLQRVLKYILDKQIVKLTTANMGFANIGA